MDKLTVTKRLAVVKHYLSGFTQLEIANKTGIGAGSVNGIVAEVKSGLFIEVADLAEQVELLRSLSVDLKNSGLTPGQCIGGLAVINRLKEWGLEVSDIEHLDEIIKLAGGAEKSKEFIGTVHHIRDFQKTTGLALHQIGANVLAMEEKAAELQPAIKKVEETALEIEEMEKKRNTLTLSVENLEHQNGMLTSVVKKLGERQISLLKQIKEAETITASTQAGLSSWNSESQKLAKAGFTIVELTEFNEKVRVVAAHHKVPVSTIRNRLLQELKVLGKNLTLEALIKDTRAELEKEQKAITSAKEEFKKLGVTNGTLSGQNALLEAEIKAKQETVTMELQTMVSAAKETVSKFDLELKQGSDKVIGVVKQLMEQALEVGFATGKYEGIVQGNEWLIALRSLAEGQETLDAAKVRGILSRVLHGAQLWIKLNEGKPGLPPELSKIVEMLVKELRGWSV